MSTSDEVDGGYGIVDGGQYRYERSPDERPSEAVVAAMAAVAGKLVVPHGADDETEALAPLYEAIDPDALDALFVSGHGSQTDRSVTFAYGDYEVTVNDREVVVASRE